MTLRLAGDVWRLHLAPRAPDEGGRVPPGHAGWHTTRPDTAERWPAWQGPRPPQQAGQVIPAPARTHIGIHLIYGTRDQLYVYNVG